jgi:phosphoglycerate dehydrogenase-like enzyme
MRNCVGAAPAAGVKSPQPIAASGGKETIFNVGCRLLSVLVAWSNSITMHCIIALENSIEAFSPDSAWHEELARRFPHHSFERVFTEEHLLAALPRADALVAWGFREQWYASTNSLRVIFTPAAGKEWVAHDPRGIVAVYHGSFHGALMAETLAAMVLYFSRRFDGLLENQRHHRWRREFLSTTRRLNGQRALIIGYGAIGRHCARLLRCLGMVVIGVRRGSRDRALDSDAHELAGPDRLDTLLPTADHLVLILPGGPDTDAMITRGRFARMSPSAYVYNLGRGNCYAEEDLVWALNQKKIAGAGLDVFAREPLADSSPLWDMPNVLISPHASAINADYMPLFLDQLTGWIDAFSWDE